ncbi:MAG: DNA alkylation repair protein [Marinosulfonomonas sp.]
MSAHLSRATDLFDAEKFQRLALDGLEKLELKQRSEQFSHAIDGAMSGSYEETVTALLSALRPEGDPDSGTAQPDDTGISGFGVMALTSFVSRNGLHMPEFSLEALAKMTSRFSSEFDVRPFFVTHPELTLNTAKAWALDGNMHVRRLASEGCRPLLPWGIRLHDFVADPSPILPILTALRDDPEDYVRRSVANNLNDIAKNQPDLVAGIAADWLQSADTNRKRLVKHACRTLLKKGHPGALAAFGFGAPDLASFRLEIGADTVVLGDDVALTLILTNGAQRQKMLIDYVMHFMRANGRLSAKVFKWTELTLDPGETRVLTKTHPYRKVTTRKDYPGMQKVTVQINGVDLGGPDFEFSIEP